MASALRSRHAAELRKRDIFALARQWGYRSETWHRRKDRQYVPTGPGALPAPAAAGEAEEMEEEEAPPPPDQMAAIAAAMAGPLQSLADRSAAAFRAGPYAPPAPPPVRVPALTDAGSPPPGLGTAVTILRRLLAALTEQATEAEGALQRLTPAEAGIAPAFSLFAGKEQPYETSLRQLVSLTDMAISCTGCPYSQGVNALALAALGGTPALGGPPPAPEPRGPKAGGLLAFELATRLSAILAQAKLAPYGTYLQATALALRLLRDWAAAVAKDLEERFVRSGGSLCG